jgi:nicotinamidase-related amidase
MPLTKLDSSSALVVIDLQKGIVGMPTVHPAGEIIGNSARLARVFREKGLPVVLVHVTGMIPRRTEAAFPKFTPPADWAEFVPELEQQADDCVVAKKTWGAFLDTKLDEYLRQRGVTQIVLTGIATSIGVESTARSAFDLGYHVTFVVDAMTDRDADAHRNSLEKIFPRMGETDTTDNVLKMLQEATGSASRP